MTNFFLISFNYFIKDYNGTYFPCELGAVSFTIKGGINTKCHALIDPGKLPLGSAFNAKDHSDKTHKLPPPPKAEGERDYLKVLTTLTDFLVKNATDSIENKFLLIVKEDEAEMVQNILSQFCDAAQMNVEQYVLLPMTYFFHKLRESCDYYYRSNTGFSFSYAVASSHLDRDIYQYHEGNGCEFHEGKEDDGINVHCALSRPMRWAYTILDQTMAICGVKKKQRETHYPKDCKIDEQGLSNYKKEESDDSDESDDFTEVKYSSRLSVKNIKPGRVKDEFDDRSSTSSSLYGNQSNRTGINEYGGQKKEHVTTFPHDNF